MEKYPDIIKALECCASPGSGPCAGCPYNGTTRPDLSCRQKLLLDVMEALATEETRADEAESKRDEMGTAMNRMAASNGALRDQCEALEESNAKLQEENKAMREELKNRPEVGFDADTFDKAVELIFKKATDAAYFEGYADALKWWLHDYFISGEEGGDDV